MTKQLKKQPNDASKILKEYQASEYYFPIHFKSKIQEISREKNLNKQ